LVTFAAAVYAARQGPIVVSESAWRRERLAGVAGGYQLCPQSGSGRFAAVVSRDGGRELVHGDQISELLDEGELVALVDPDLVRAELGS
jgi:hypothetical protein